MASETVDPGPWKCDLEHLNYRQLQSKAKELALPGNLKHHVLVGAITARRRGDESEVERILGAEKDERARKKAAKRLLEYSMNSSRSSPPRRKAGRPRTKSIASFDDSFNSSAIGGIDRSGSLGNLTLHPNPLTTANHQSPVVPHSIQQLLMDRSVPNASTKQFKPALPRYPTTPQQHRYTFKTVHRSIKDTSGCQVYQEPFNRQRKSWEPNNNVEDDLVPQNLSFNNSVHNSSHPYDKPFQGPLNDIMDTNSNCDYLPDLAGLLGTNSLPSHQVSNYPSAPVYLRQDLWAPYPTTDAYQPPSYQPAQCYHHDYTWPIWSGQFPPNPTGYSEEVVVSETQNSDTLSAPENPDLIPPPSNLSGTYLTPENDNQVYWPKSELGSSSLSSSTINTSSCNQSHSSSLSPEKNGVSHMRVSVMDTHEWTYEYSTTPGIFAQPFLHL